MKAETLPGVQGKERGRKYQLVGSFYFLQDISDDSVRYVANIPDICRIVNKVDR